MLSILYEDNHCLAINKPAGLLSQGDITGEPTVLDLAREYLKTRYNKPGNVYLGLVHRLDRPTSGVVLLAKTSKAAARLSEQFRSGQIAKVYLAAVEGGPAEQEGEWTDTLVKDHARNVVRVSQHDSNEGSVARVAFRVLVQKANTTLLELRPLTGRSHQLRVQLASRGMPIVGDIKYGARSPLTALDGKPRVALHAWQISFEHPTRREVLAVTAPVPADWPGPWPDADPGEAPSR
jgi:23S rRNA pseudouridine1911/1915/1917 synthase